MYSAEQKGALREQPILCARSRKNIKTRNPLGEQLVKRCLNMAPPSFSPSFDDITDFKNADRGFITSLSPCIIKDKQGRVVWDNDEYAFLSEPCPSTANPKLWRQGQLNSKQGLYQITDGIYQVRGFDISNVSFVEGKTGVIVIDPLVSCECAAAALKLYRSSRGDRPVTGLIYSHSHIDHFGGAAGVLSSSEQSTPTIPIIAPEGFMAEATSENITAGPIMKARAAHMYGAFLPKSATGQIGVGLGMGTSRGTTSLIPPTVHIAHTGQQVEVDGVKIVFQMVPETEAPAEVNFYFPDSKALLIAECATHCLHNIITLRGTLVRDCKAWSRYIDESIVLYAERSDVLFGSHNWPTWGKQNLIQLLEEQRDLYGYLHDQTVRMMNEGLVGSEIAEKMVLPQKLQQAWHAQGYYGSVSHNVKGIYQRYMTWFDGKAENLWKWPPKEEATRYVDCIGGIESVLKKAEDYVAQGDLRFAATLLGHATIAQPSSQKAKTSLAAVFEQLGYNAENATWRNFYLSQAQELRKGKGATQPRRGLDAFGDGLSIQQWLDVLSIRVDGEQAAEDLICVEIHVKDTRQRWMLTLSNGALTSRVRAEDEMSSHKVASSMALTRRELQALLQGTTQLVNTLASGDNSAVRRILEVAGVSGPGRKTSSNL